MRSWFKKAAEANRSHAQGAMSSRPAAWEMTFRALEEIERAQEPKVVVETTPRGGAIIKGGTKARAEFFEQFIDWSSDLAA